MINKKIQICTLILAALTCTKINAVDASGIRDGRYCEIIIGKSLTTYAVYNTWGLNHCPEDKWGKITVKSVQNEMNASRVHLNGPRYWVIDGFEKTNLQNPKVNTIGGIAMREAGILHLNLSSLLKNKFYTPREVDRQTTWIYDANKRVYELIDPTGQVYVMQSYSTNLHPQTLSSLKNLKTSLHLPAGWQFKTGILTKTEKLVAINKKATVIQDDFLNTYQLATHDYLL